MADNQNGAIADELEALIADVQDYDRPLPWVVHSGSSYRRIASESVPENGYRPFPDGNVLRGYTQKSDGHPDLSMGEQQLKSLVGIINLVPTILSALRTPSPTPVAVGGDVVIGIQEFCAAAGVDCQWYLDGGGTSGVRNMIETGGKLAALQAQPSTAQPDDVVERIVAAIKNLPMWDGDTVGMNLTRDELGAIARAALAAMPVQVPVADDVLQSHEKFDGVGLHSETIETRARIGESYLDAYASALTHPLLTGYSPADCPSELLIDLLDRLTTQPPAEAATGIDDPDAAYILGKDDGRSEALQEIDRLTGGDGEYRYCMGGGEDHCPDPDAMQSRIVERFKAEAAIRADEREQCIEIISTAADYKTATPAQKVMVRNIIHAIRSRGDA